MAQAVPFKLSDGNRMPTIAYGFGSANLSGSRDEIVQRTLMAIQNGYYHLDCAEAYNNEEFVGEAIKASGVPREKLFITSKVTGLPNQDVEKSFQATLDKLGVSYVDLYLIHVPYAVPDQMPSFWSQLEAIKESGRAKSIGVSNFLQKHLESILEAAKIPPAINQIEYHPYLQHGDLVKFCREKNIAVSAYSVLTEVFKARPGPVDPVYADLAKKYGVTEGDIAMKFCLDQNIAVVTTSSNAERLKHFSSTPLTFGLHPTEIEKISQLGQEKHYRVLYGDFFGPDDKS